MIRGGKPHGFKAHLPIVYPAVMLAVLFLAPFGIMVAISFFTRDPSSFYTPAFDISNYTRLATLFFARILGFSLFVAAIGACVCVLVGFPFTYLLTRLRQRTQVIFLVFLLSVLSLSEVIIGFSWSLLLSQTAGVTNLLVWLGLMDKPVSLSPGFMALLCGYVFLSFPYTILVLYPPLSRLDPALPEAAQTMGASPVMTFFTVVVASQRNAIVSAFIMIFVFDLGIYLLPQILGRPHHWTISVHITDKAIYQSNLPYAAAMAVFLMVVSLVLVGLTMRLGRQKELKR